MADPISIVSVAVGLIEIGTKLASKVKAFVSDFRDAPSDFERVWDELSTICLILGEVEGMLRDPLHSPFPPETVTNLRLLLGHTMKAFIEFEKFVDGFGSQGNGTQLLGGYQQGRWASAEKHIKDFRDVLETHKASLNISLQLGTLLATANIIKVVGDMQADIGNVRANTDTANAELIKLKAMCQKLLDRERVIAGGSSADSGEPPDRSEASSAIVAYVESTELLAEELIAPKLRPPSLPETSQPSSAITERVAAPAPNSPHPQGEHSPTSVEYRGTLRMEGGPPAPNEVPQARGLRYLFSASPNHNRQSDPKSEGLDFQAQRPSIIQPFANEQFVKAASSGDRATVERLIMSGTNVNSRSRDNQTALQEAVRNRHEAIVRILLYSGANVDARALGDTTALQLAAHLGYNRIVQLLMNYGADVHARPGPFGTALNAAGLASTRESILGHPMYTRRAPYHLPDKFGRRGAVGDALFKEAFKSLLQVAKCLCCGCHP